MWHLVVLQYIGEIAFKFYEIPKPAGMLDGLLKVSIVAAGERLLETSMQRSFSVAKLPCCLAA